VILKLELQPCGYGRVLEIAAHAVKGLYSLANLFDGGNREKVGASAMLMLEQERRLIEQFLGVGQGSIAILPKKFTCELVVSVLRCGHRSIFVKCS
jgi:hypothetical protein